MTNQKFVELTQEQSLDICVADFFESLAEACEQAGGKALCSHQTTLAELAKLLAPNGVRFSHCPQRTITNVQCQCYTGFFPPAAPPPVKKAKCKDDEVDVSIFDRGMGRP